MKPFEAVHVFQELKEDEPTQVRVKGYVIDILVLEDTNEDKKSSIANAYALFMAETEEHYKLYLVDLQFLEISKKEVRNYVAHHYV